MADPLDSNWHRQLLDELCAIPRESASAGERRAADWLVAQLRQEGVQDVRIEEIRAHSSFWWPLGLTSLAGFLTGFTRSRRAAALTALAAFLGGDDLPPGRRLLRRVLPKATATNVIATLGPADAQHTLILVGHHDAAHSGVIFNPAMPEAIDRRFPAVFRHADTSPPLMWPAVLGPLISAIGALFGWRRVGWFGSLMSGLFGAAMANIGASPVVPGANDNGTGEVVLLAVARALRERPAENLRVILLSTSEEGLCDGMRDFAQRHLAGLPKERTFVLAIDTVGSPKLLVLRGEGMLRMREYPAPALTLMDGLAAELGIELVPNLRLRNATDGIWPLAAGYPCASLCSCSQIKQPANYHWPTDLPENVNLETLRDAVRLGEALVRRLDAAWL